MLVTGAYILTVALPQLGLSQSLLLKGIYSNRMTTSLDLLSEHVIPSHTLLLGHFGAWRGHLCLLLGLGDASLGS